MDAMHVDTDTVDLSHMRCDLSGLEAEAAAKKFHAFLCDVADVIDHRHPNIYRPGEYEASQGCWWVLWENCPWPEWAITGGGWSEGPLAGWESLRNGVHNERPELGPFFRQLTEEEHRFRQAQWARQEWVGPKPKKTPWYFETYYGYDVFLADSRSYGTCERCGIREGFLYWDDLKAQCDEDWNFTCSRCFSP